MNIAVLAATMMATQNANRIAQQNMMRRNRIAMDSTTRQTKKKASKKSSSAKVENYYKALKAAAASKYYIDARHIGVFANSADYPDTVTLTLEDMAKYDIAVFVQYTGSQASKAYAIPMRDLMPIIDKWFKEGHTLLCDSSSVDVDEVGNLVRVPFEPLKDYQIEVSKEDKPDEEE